MKLTSIRLHPFGGTADRTYTLRDGLNILEGPNEFGKSTLSHALWNALFTPTNLTPAKLRDTVGRWYPQPGGDHARVTLHFEAEGKAWTLEKSWGGRTVAASRLQGTGVPAIADPDRVQVKLNELLRLNEATWSRVLFTRQAELARTLEALRYNADKIDDVHGLLKGAAAIPGDIAAEKLLTTVQERVDAHFKRWDVAAQGPEKGRGIDSPWKNDLGPLVNGYYEKEMVRRDLDSVLRYEQELDAINGSIQSLTAQMDADADFVNQGTRLREGLGRRGALEERITRLTNEGKVLMQVMTEWPGVAQVIQGKEQEMGRIAEALERMDTDLQHARKHAQAEQLRKGHAALTTAKEAYEAAAKDLARAAPVDEQVINTLKDLERRLRDLDIQIAAQKLAAKLESRSPRSVTVQRGTEAPETVAITPEGPWVGDASGRIRVEVGDLTLSVQSGQEDVDALFAQRDQARERHTQLLASAGAADLMALQEAHKAYGALVQEVSRKQGLYTAALQEKTLEEWDAEMAALAALPQTRDLVALEDERAKHLAQQADLRAFIDQERRKVEQWVNDHADVSTLTDKVVEQRAALRMAELDLAQLPALPAGFTSVPEYLRLLQQKEDARAALKDRLGEARTRHAVLADAPPARTAEDLRAELDLKEREFQRRLAEGQALLRIQARLEAVIAQRGGGDPLQGLTDAISKHFNDLTAGRYTGVQLNGTAPALVNGTAALPTDLLSQGTLGSLALATRLALAELYLKDDSGFLVMDDPFTDMDPARRTAAAKALGHFARERQVLLFTCQPMHAKELTAAGGVEVMVA